MSHSHSLALSNSSLASSSYLGLSEEEQRKVVEHKREREARSLAVEKAYVHDVYEQISGNISTPCLPSIVFSDFQGTSPTPGTGHGPESNSSSPPWSRERSSATSVRRVSQLWRGLMEGMLLNNLQLY